MTNILKVVKRFFFVCLKTIPFSWDFLSVPRGRKNFFSKDCKLIKVDYILPETKNRDVYDSTRLKETHYDDYQAFSLVIKDCKLIGPGLVATTDDGYLCAESLMISKNYDISRSTAEQRPPIFKTKFTLSGKYASLVTHWSYWKGYYHWLIDVLPLISYIESDRKIIVRSPLSKYEKESLDLLGLLPRCEYVGGFSYSVEDFQFISPLGQSCAYNKSSYENLRNLYQSILEKIEVNTKTKLYITRKGERRCAGNEDEVIQLFMDAGFEIINPKDYSFEQQMQLFKRADTVIGQHGAALANIIWCDKATRVVELFIDDHVVHSNENIALFRELEFKAYFKKDLLRGDENKRILSLEFLKSIIDDV